MTKWVTKKLGEICEKITDGSHDSPKPVDDGYYMPSVKDMRNDNFDFSDCKQISKNDFERLKGTGCKPEIGDVLIAKDGSILKYCFVVEQDLPIVILSSIAILRPDKSIIDGKFLSYYFQKEDVVTDVVENYKSGTGVPRIVLRNFEQIEIPYPESLAEQRRIAGILSSADGAIAASEALIEKYRNIKRGLLTTLLQPKEGWKKVKLGEVGHISMCKRIFSFETTAEGDIPFYKIGTFGKVADAYITKEKYEEYKTRFSFPNKGDILLSASGTIGRTVIYDGEPAYFQDSNIIWLAHDETIVLNEFLYYLYKITSWNLEGSTIVRLYNDNFNKIEISVPYKNGQPDLAEQHRIAEILSSVDAKIAAEEKVVEKYKGVKKGLMEEMMRKCCNVTKY